jgi:para-aminobenzoate synthetase component 1
VHGDQAVLSVAIRTFWREREFINFGTGAGITWGSDANAEWDETQLKAERLISIIGGEI